MNRGVSVWSSVGLCKFGRERHLAAAAKLTLKTLSKMCLDTVFKIFDTNFCVIQKNARYTRSDMLIVQYLRLNYKKFFFFLFVNLFFFIKIVNLFELKS